VSGRLLAPIPGANRPPLARWRLAAPSAIVAGVRPHAEITEVPRPIVCLCSLGDLRQQDRRVVRPALGDVDSVIAEILRLGRQPKDHICPRLKWREPHTHTAWLLNRVHFRSRLLSSGHPRRSGITSRCPAFGATTLTR
jgi:hypothetical protein